MNNTTSNKSIASNIKSIIKTSINIPLELTSVSLEVVNDVTQLTSRAVRGAVPVTKDLGKITGNFVLGACNPSMDDEQLAAIDTDVSKALEKMVAGARKGGRNTTRSIVQAFEDETHTDNTVVSTQ